MMKYHFRLLYSIFNYLFLPVLSAGQDPGQYNCQDDDIKYDRVCMRYLSFLLHVSFGVIKKGLLNCFGQQDGVEQQFIAGCCRCPELRVEGKQDQLAPAFLKPYNGSLIAKLLFMLKVTTQ